MCECVRRGENRYKGEERREGWGGGGCFTQRKMDVAIQVERRWRNIDEKAEGRYRGRG